MISGLRDQDRRVLEVIDRLSEERDYPLSYDELQTAAGVSSLESLEASLHRLETDGYILRNDEIPFGFEVLLDNEGRPIQRPGPQYLPAGLGLPAGRVNIRGEEVESLTRREQQVYDSIIEAIEDQGYPPRTSNSALRWALRKLRFTIIFSDLQKRSGSSGTQQRLMESGYYTRLPERTSRKAPS